MASPTSGAPDTLASIKSATWVAGAVPVAFVLHMMLFRNSWNTSGLLRIEFTKLLAVAAIVWLGKVSEIVPEPYLVSLGTICHGAQYAYNT